MATETEKAVEEVKRLKACLNDLISVLALPAIWSGGGPPEVITALLDALLGMLRLEFAYGEIKNPAGGAPVRMVRFAQPGNPTARLEAIAQALRPWLGDDPHPSPLVVPNLIKGRGVSIAPLRLGLRDEIGWLVAGSWRPDFPTQTERLLLSVAANRAAIGLHEARLLSEQRQVAQELEQKVAQRTRDLNAANEGLTREIAERKRVEEQLRRSEAYLAEGQRLSLTGSFGWHVPSGEVHWSEEAYRICGLDPTLKPTVEAVRRRVHPDDRAYFNDVTEQSLRQGKDSDFELRLVMPEGSVKYIQVALRTVRDESGQLIQFVGALRDVSAAKIAFQQIQELKDRLQKENVVLREEVDAASMFEEIVGTSAALQAVLSRVSKVAPTDSTVLITGETGTGKELIARAIHKRSGRSGRGFVAVNCAAIPPSLIAS